MVKTKVQLNLVTNFHLNSQYRAYKILGLRRTLTFNITNFLPIKLESPLEDTSMPKKYLGQLQCNTSGNSS